MDDGSPELTSETKRKYKFDSRFLDDMLRVSWDTAFTYAAKAMIVIATRYSGEAGARRLREQGYAPEMIEMMKGAGTRCFKHRSGMPVLGIIGKMGNTRMNGGVNALLDTWIRKVSPDQAQGGRYWSNYTWHGDQNPAHPWWSGVQGSDIDLSDMRFSKLNTSWGKNFVENKMPEAHWKLECIERGARVVVITPEYNPTAYRADYWMPLRPESDGSLFLGAMKIIVDENMHDIDFMKSFSDAPILVRTDTLQYLDPRFTTGKVPVTTFIKPSIPGVRRWCSSSPATSGSSEQASTPGPGTTKPGAGPQRHGRVPAWPFTQAKIPSTLPWIPMPMGKKSRPGLTITAKKSGIGTTVIRR